MWSLLSVLLLASLVPVGPQDHLRAHRAADASLVAGRLGAARAAFERCLAESPDNPTIAYGLACTEARAGNLERAFEWLGQAVAWGYPDAAVASWDEDLTTLRDDPRFAPLLEAMEANALPPAGQEPARRTAPFRIANEPVDLGRTARFLGREDVARSSCSAMDRVGEVAAVGDDEGVVVLLEARSGRELRRWAELESPVWALAFDPGGERLAALTWDGRLHVGPVDGRIPPIHRRVLATAGGEQERDWPFGAVVQFDAEGARILVGARQRGAGLWCGDGEVLQFWPSPHPASLGVRLAWSPDGRSVAVPGGVLEERSENEVRFLDLGAGDPVRPPLVTPSRVECVAFLPDGWRLATGHEDGSVRVWDLETAGMLDWFDVVPEPFSGGVNALGFSPDGDRLAAAWGQDISSGAWSAKVAACDMPAHERWWTGPGSGRVIDPFDLRWSPDGRHLVYGFADDGVLYAATPGAAGWRPLTARGRPVRPGTGGIAVVTDFRCEQGLDLSAGRVLWMRPRLGPDAVLTHTPEGYFQVERGELTGLSVLSAGKGAEPEALIDLVQVLFDPKRVRAGRAGVRIVEPRL